MILQILVFILFSAKIDSMSPEVALQGLEQKLPAKPDVSVPEPFLGVVATDGSGGTAPPEPAEGVADVINIHPISLVLELRRNPDIYKMEDSSRSHTLVDKTATYLQAELAKRDDDAEGPQSPQFIEALEWLKTAVYPINMNFAKRYLVNSRFDLDDFFQVLNTTLVSEHVPKYDASKSHFLSYYKHYGWQRLQEQVYLSASHLSTTAHFGQVDNDAKDAAMQSFSYDHLPSPDAEGSAVLDFHTAEGDDDAVIRPIMARDILERTAVVIEELLTDTEQTALRLFLDGQTYEEMSHLMGISTKSVDNALQRGRKKIAHIRSGAAKGFFSGQEEQAA